MTDATKATRSPTPGTASRKRDAAAKKSPSGRAEKDQDADIRAGEAAMRDATRLAKTAGSSPRPAQRRTAPAAKAAEKTKAAAKSTAPGTVRAPAQGPARAAQPPRAEPPAAERTPAAAGLDVWLGTAGRLQDAGLRAGTALARSQLTAAQSSAALGFRLADLTMAQARAQLGAVQAMISTAELQRRVVRQAFDAAAGQAKMMRSLMNELAGSSARTWTAFEKGAAPERKKAR